MLSLPQVKSNVGLVFVSEAINEDLPELFNLRRVTKGLVVCTTPQFLYGGWQAIVG